MLIRRPSDIPSSEITPRGVYLLRRDFMTGAVALGVTTMLPAGASAVSYTHLTLPTILLV